MSDLEEVKQKIDELTATLQEIDMPSERESVLSARVVNLCNAIGVNLGWEEACAVARRTLKRLAELEAQNDLTKVSSEELLEEVARRMDVAIDDLGRGNG